MSDPFDSLFSTDESIAPTPAFAAELHSRLLDELYDQLSTDTNPMNSTDETNRGNHMSTADDMTDTMTPVNAGSLFYFTIPAADPERAAAFYGGLFGWDCNQGSAGYHVNNVYPPMGIQTGDSRNPEVWIEVDDIEAAVARVRELGGTAEDPALYDSGWNSACTDPQGVAFNVTVPTPAYRQAARSSSEPGELFYWTLPAPDATRSKEFYTGLFGWEFSSPGDQGGMHIENAKPDGGLGGGREGTHPDLFFRVSDLELAASRVRELGGTAELVGGGDEGQHAMCTDDQGVSFGISQPAEGY